MKAVEWLGSKVVASLAILCFIAATVPAYATVEDVHEIPPLECGVNAGIVTDHFEQYLLMANFGSDEKNDDAAKRYCAGRATAFDRKCESTKTAYEGRTCPQRCPNKVASYSSADSTLFAFEQRRHPGESDKDYKRRRDRAIDDVISQGDCGYSKDAQTACRGLIERGALTIAYCLGDWTLDWMTICD